MGNNFEKYAVAVIIVFGAIIIGGLMAYSISSGRKSAFLFALGAATAAWLAGHALLLDRARIYAAIVGISVLFALASTIALVI